MNKTDLKRENISAENKKIFIDYIMARVKIQILNLNF